MNSRFIALLSILFIITIVVVPGVVSAQPLDRTYNFGMAGDIPVSGDWDGDRTTDIGVFRPSARQFIFNSMPVTRTTFGLSTDLPITGDWDGDGRTDIGVFRPSARQFIFNGTPVTRITFGLSTDLPITGDWNGDGITDIGVFRPSAGQFIFNGEPVTRITFGLGTDLPITGDWNGDGKTEAGVFRPSTPSFYLDYNGNGAWDGAEVDRAYNFGVPGGIPVSGDWNGDGKTEVGFTSGSSWYLDTTGDVAAPVASFTSDITSGMTPLTVRFTDQSVSPGFTSFAWDINNDGVVDYTDRNPVHTYPSAGTYSVALTVTNAGGSDTEVRTSYITVSSPVQPGECYGAESCNPTGNPLGGGAGYTWIISESDPRVKYVVSTKDQLLSALKAAKSGDVVYVKGNANIDLTGTYGTTVPGGVTLASNRGEGGSLGGRIFQNRIPTDPTYDQILHTNCALLMAGGDDVRITGLRLEGPDKTTADLKAMGLGMKNGIAVWDYRLLEVDNCEIWGWGWAGIAVRATTGSDNACVHHNYIHHCQDSNVGYGVALTGGTAIIEANKFDYTKHAVTGSGHVGEVYEARYNLHLGHSTGPVFDVHAYTNPANGQSIAGDTYKIHHNTVLVTDKFAVGIRAVPVQGVWIDHNGFQWYDNNGRDEPPVYQSGGSGRIFMTQNLIGSDQVLYPQGPVLQL